MYKHVDNNGSVYIYTTMQYVAASYLYPSSLGFSSTQRTNMSLSCYDMPRASAFRADHYSLSIKGAVHDFMGDFDVLHLVFCLAYMHKSAFID